MKTWRKRIIALETAALERWGKGDPSGFLELSDPEVTYFDPFAGRRLDGLAALTKLYEGLRGQVQVDSFELVNPRVQSAWKIIQTHWSVTAAIKP